MISASCLGGDHLVIAVLKMSDSHLDVTSSCLRRKTSCYLRCFVSMDCTILQELPTLRSPLEQHRLHHPLPQWSRCPPQPLPALPPGIFRQKWGCVGNPNVWIRTPSWAKPSNIEKYRQRSYAWILERSNAKSPQSPSGPCLPQLVHSQRHSLAPSWSLGTLPEELRLRALTETTLFQVFL